MPAPDPLAAHLARADEIEAGLAILRDAVLARGEHVHAHYLLIALRRLTIEAQALRVALADSTRAADRPARRAKSPRARR